jgi:hypothetical protein
LHGVAVMPATHLTRRRFVRRVMAAMPFRIGWIVLVML